MKMLNKILLCKNPRFFIGSNSKQLINCSLNHNQNKFIKSNINNIIFVNITRYSHKNIKYSNFKLNNISYYKESYQRFKSRSANNFQLINDNKILLKRVYNTEVNSNETKTSATATSQGQSLSIFKRFKDAYKQHGKILIYTHIVLCCGWIVGFYFLSTW